MKGKLRLRDLIGIGIGSMIGGGIFVASGLAIEQAGPWAVLSFALATVLALMTGRTYAMLSMKYPYAGGSYAFVRASLPHSLSEGFGKLLLFGYLAAISLYSATFGIYLSQFINLDYRILGTFLVIVMSSLNIIGVKENSRVLNILVALKVAILIVIALAAIWLINPANFHFTSGILSAIPPISFIFIGFQGFEIIANAVEESTDKDDVVKAIYLSILSVAAIYLLLVIILIGVFGSNLLHEEHALFDLAVESLGTLGGVLITLSAIISTSSAANGAIFGSSRVLYSMSLNNSSYRGLSYLHPKRGTPILAILVVSSLSLLLLWLLPLKTVASIPSIVFLLSFLLVNVVGYREGSKFSIVPTVIITAFVAFSEIRSLVLTLGIFTLLILIEATKEER